MGAPIRRLAIVGGGAVVSSGAGAGGGALTKTDFSTTAL